MARTTLVRSARRESGARLITAVQKSALEAAATALDAVSCLVTVVGTLAKSVNEHHPLYYQANRLWRDVDELRVALRREAAK